MSRSFSSAARALLKFIWKGTEPVAKYENVIKTKLSKNPKLVQADTVEISGRPHTSLTDSKLHVSGQIFRDSTRLTSVHAYDDGTIEYSKQSYNDSQEV